MRCQGRSKGRWRLLPLASSAGLQVGSAVLLCQIPYTQQQLLGQCLQVVVKHVSPAPLKIKGKSQVLTSPQAQSPQGFPRILFKN